MLRLATPALVLLLAGCSADEPSADDGLAGRVEEAVRDAEPFEVQTDGLAISSEVEGEPAESIVTRDGQMELGLTDRVLYSRLSKDAQAEIRAELEQSTEETDGLGGRIARAVAEAAAQNVGTAAQIPLSDVQDLRVEGGRLVIEMADGERSPFGNVSTGDTPLLEAFSAGDAERLAEAFRRLRQP